MKGTFSILVALVSAVALHGPGWAGTLVIGSYDGSRALAPFTAGAGSLGYGQLQSSLLDPAKFGSGGIVACDVVIAPGTGTITDSYLADKSVFFTSLFTGPLSSSEKAAITSFVARGGCVIVDANSSRDEQVAANSMLEGTGVIAGVSSDQGCENSPVGGVIVSTPSVVTDGPFGDVGGGSFGTSLSALLVPGSGFQALVSCGEFAERVRGFFTPGSVTPTSGLIMFGGDPSAANFFTEPGQPSFNPNNEIMYLNAIAACCRPPPTCPLTRGFLQNHIDAWSVTSLSLGCQSYNQAELLSLLTSPAKSDASLILAQELIPTKINFANGADPLPISSRVSKADRLLCQSSGRLPLGIRTSSVKGEGMVSVARKLRHYNQSELTPDCLLPCE